MNFTKKQLINMAYEINKSKWVFETNSQSFFRLVEQDCERGILEVYSGEILRNKFTYPTDLGILAVGRRAILYAEEPDRERNVYFDISCGASCFEDKFFSSSARRLYDFLLNKD